MFPILFLFTKITFFRANNPCDHATLFITYPHNDSSGKISPGGTAGIFFI
jgi:hypothetical protein